MAAPGLAPVRALGVFSLTAISINTIIGAGIFALPGSVAQLVGSSSALVYVAVGAAALLIALCFADASSRFESSGGPYMYARTAFGPLAGFEVAWMFLLARLSAVAAVANTFADYLSYFWPGMQQAPGRWLAITAMIGGLAASHYFGIRLGAAVNNIFTIGKLLPLFAFCAAGLVLLPVDIPLRAPLPGASSLQQAGLLLMFAMSGFENASIPSEEAVNPRKNMPLALIGSVCLVAVLFFTIQVVAMAALPELGKSATPLASAAQSFLGPVGGLMLTAGAVLSTAGSNHVNLLVGPRVLYALGRDGQLPAAVARLHPVYRTPAFSIVLYATAGWALALATGFAQLAALSAIARLVVYASTCLAVPVLRRRQPSLPEGFRLAGGAGVPALALLVCAWLLAGSSWIQAMIAGAALLAGGLLFALLR